MKIYLDTGIFIDYLTARVNHGLRTAGRGARSIAQVALDAEKLLNVASQKHHVATSCLTYYEVEEALYKSLSAAAKGVSHVQKLLVPAARSLMVQTQMVVNAFGIVALDLKPATIALQLQTTMLSTEGIRAADALHIATALEFGAELLVSADEQILKLDNMLGVPSGKLRCLDSDGALRLL